MSLRPLRGLGSDSLVPRMALWFFHWHLRAIGLDFRAIVPFWARAMLLARGILRRWVNRRTAAVSRESTQQTARASVPCRPSSARFTRQATRPVTPRAARQATAKGAWKAAARRGPTPAPSRRPRPARHPVAGAGFWDCPASAVAPSCSATRPNVHAAKPR
jgi:hypothetical protein